MQLYNYIKALQILDVWGATLNNFKFLNYFTVLQFKRHNVPNYKCHYRSSECCVFKKKKKTFIHYYYIHYISGFENSIIITDRVLNENIYASPAILILYYSITAMWAWLFKDGILFMFFFVKCIAFELQCICNIQYTYHIY